MSVRLSISTSAAAGGPSACATGGGGPDQTSYAIVDATCAGYAKPSWQSGISGNPADGVRDIPDVSIFASNGIWGHYVTVCYSDTANGGTSCAGSPSGWAGFGGTSVSAPMMAAIQSLVNEKWSLTKVGNPDPTYYSIAKSEFGSSGNSACYSINQPPRAGLASACTFYDITQGDIDIDCKYNGTIESAATCPRALMVRSAPKPYPAPAQSPRAAPATPALPRARSARQAISAPISRLQAQLSGAEERKPHAPPPSLAEPSPPSPSPTRARDTPAAQVARSLAEEDQALLVPPRPPPPQPLHRGNPLTAPGLAGTLLPASAA